jgi:hypothetical protein
MRIIPRSSEIMDYGTRQLFSGLRRGNVGASGLGTALVVLAWMREHRAPLKERLYATNLREGETLRIRLVRDGVVEDETDVSG